MLSRKNVVQPKNVNLNDIIVEVEKMLATGDRRRYPARIRSEPFPGTRAGGSRAVAPGADEPGGQCARCHARTAVPCASKPANVDLDENFAETHAGMKPGPLCPTESQRHRCGHDQGGSVSPLRAILHHQGNRGRDGAGPGNGIRHRQAMRRIDLGPERTGPGTTFTIHLPRMPRPGRGR